MEATSLRRASPLLLLAFAALCAFVGARWLVASSHSHLLFHYDRAEYAYYGAVAYDLDRPTLELVVDPDSRQRFLARTCAVGDMGLHGSTVLAGLAVHAALVHGGAEVSTWTLKRLALGFSTLTLGLWLLVLGRAWREPAALAAFAALFVLAPAALVKLNLLLWGTHELVLLLHALLLAVVCGWVGDPTTARRTACRALGLGLLGGLLFFLNFSLLLPLSFVSLWLVLEQAGARRRSTAALLGVAGFALSWGLITSSPGLRELGFSPWILDNPRVGEVASAWHGPLDWFRALGVAPWLVPGGLAAGWILVRPGAEGLDRHPLTRMLASYLLVAFVVIASLPMGWLAGDGDPVFQHRFVGHLYPVSLAVLAAWCFGRGPRLGGGVLGLLLLAGLLGQLRATDAVRNNVVGRYDGAALYCEIRGEDCRDIPRDRFRLGGASPSFLRGMALLTRYQKLEQLEWVDRGKLDAVAVEAQVTSWIAESWRPGRGPEARGEFLRGIGYALRLLAPPGRDERLEGLWPALGTDATLVQEGYMVLPESLEAR